MVGMRRNMMEVKVDDIYLMPFCVESVLMFHKLKKEGLTIAGFFDNNIRLANGNYCEVPIMLPFYARERKVMVCNEKYYKVLTDQMIEFTYKPENVLDWRKYPTKYTNVDICNEVDLETYRRLSPYEAIYDNDATGRNGTIIIKELRAFKKISSEYDDGIDSYHTIPFFDATNCDAKLPDMPRYRDTTNSPLFVVDNCDLKITDVCTLRCKYCSVLLDYPVERHEFEITRVIETFDSFLNKIDFARRMTLLGGEPFTYSHIKELLKYVINNEKAKEKIGILYIYSNATVIPDDEICDLLREADVFIVVSNYTTVSTKISEFVNKLNYFGVHYGIGKMDENWFDMNSIVPYGQAAEKSATCNATNCPEIEDGKFYKCAFLLQAYKLGEIPYDKRNFIEIADIDKNKLREYRQSFTPGCGWCKGRNISQWETDRVIAGEQLSKPRIVGE